MGIKLLTKEVVNQISAGEVVEKPASIVKELVENSIDAGATNIIIEIEGGGISKIAITDNGCGINKEEVKLAFMPHATSKLEKISDLDCLATMGFRGEALATISAVSKVSLITKTENDDAGIRIELIGGEETSRTEVACTTGTKIEVKDIFYNTPARLKFLRKPKAEEGDITNYVEKLILSHSNISFKYIVDGKLIYNTISGSVIDNIYSIYGKETANNVLEVDYSLGGYSLKGFVSKPEFGKANRTYQTLFVNSRFCNNSLVSAAVSNAYENFTMKGKFPLYVLYLTLPQNEVDVNVHPNKLEVKFVDTRKIYQLCIDAVFKALSDYNHIRSVNLPEEKPATTNVSFASISPDEGISYFSGLTNKKEEEQFKFDNDNLETKEDWSSEFFKKNSNHTGSISFELSKGVLQEVVLSEIDEISNKGIEGNSNSYVEEKQQQESYKELFNYEYNVVGKIFNTYLILEQEDKVYFVDQHAAHERQRYDALIKEVDEGFINKQALMFPYSFETSQAEYNFIIDNLDMLNSFGIEISEFGASSFKINAIPVALSEINLKDFIGALLSNINGFSKSPKEIIKEKIMQIACKSAVKGGDDLKDIEIKHLLKILKENTSVLLCPHGRPIIVEIDKKQIEKWFKRIV